MEDERVLLELTSLLEPKEMNFPTKNKISESRSLCFDKITKSIPNLHLLRQFLPSPLTPV